MLINLYGKVNADGVIIFDNLPCIYFTPNHTVHVSEMSIKWIESIDKCFGQLNSTLIDRSPINPKQQLLFIYHRSSGLTHVKPNPPAVYKIQCSNLAQSVFSFTEFDVEKIEKVYLQLSIAYEGFQQILK